MRVLFPYMARWYAANWSRYHQLLTAMQRAGHQAIVLQPPPRATSETNYVEIAGMRQAAGPTVVDVALPGWLWQPRWPFDKLVKKGAYSLACRSAVARLRQQETIDLLLLYNLPQAVLVRRAGCAVVLDIADDLPAMLAHEVGPAVGGLAQRLAATMLRRLASRCDLVTVASGTLQERLPFPTLLVPNGVDPVELAAASSGRVAVPAGRPVVGYLGAIEYFIDVDLVLGAAQGLPQVTFLLVGGGRQLAAARRRVKALGLDNVLLPGPVAHDRGLDYVAAMDLGLIPFVRGPVADGALPLKLFEYAGLGKPIISTRSAEVQRVASSFAHWADTPAELRATIQWLLAHPAQAAERAERGRRLAIEQYTWSAAAEQLAVAMQEAVEKKRARGLD